MKSALRPLNNSAPSLDMGKTPAQLSRRQLQQEVDQLRAKVAQQMVQVQELKKQALRDELTGLPNRRAFDKELQRSLESFSRYNRNGALLMIDVNSFKGINDTLGHAAGDAILQHISRMLEAYTRLGDTVARLGGDEFAVILNEVSPEQAQQKAAQIQEMISTTTCRYNGHDIHVSISVGTCSFLSANDEAGLMQMADAAMYRDKARQ